ncbi:MAG: hypothetical protein ABI624_01510 [Casimicrobiaceae bacterium]
MLEWLKRKSPQAAPKVSAAPDPDTIIAAADVARERGERAEAIRLYTSAHDAAPQRVYPLYWLATLLEEAGDPAQAFKFGERGLALDPDQIALLARMGNIASERHDPMAALEFYQRVARLDCDYPDIDALLADQLCVLGHLREGIAAFDRALIRTPASLQLQQARLFCLNFSDQLSPTALAEEHRAWGRNHSPERPAPAIGTAKAGGGKSRLHIGYVSPDLRNHAVAYFVAPLLERHDRTLFEISVFDTSADAEDAMTARMRAHVDTWERVDTLADEALAATIRAAGVDILVDLSGHTKGNRLLVFAERAAPVQVSWLGYLATTGLPAMDYRLTDAEMDPPGMTEALHTEQLLLLPVQACFSPWPDAPAVSPSPLAGGARLTFGSVNQWAKVTEATRDLWASILVACPEARLCVIARGGQNPQLQRSIAADFERRGASAGQVTVFPFGSTTDFLRFLGQVDVALDPFPYGGGTTTMQCLWMGVPVVTLAGATPMSRNAIGPLVRAGLADLVAASRAAYREKAIALGRNAALLSRLRRELRPRMAASASMDARAFARGIEEAYRTMWGRLPKA